MTREEAVQRLKTTDACDVDLCEALDMAIKALEQEPCGDCISREDAINQFVQWYSDLLETQKEEVDFKDVLKVLPSVTPMPKMGRWEYIKKEDSYRCSLCGFPCHKDNLGAIPTDYCAGCGAKIRR